MNGWMEWDGMEGGFEGWCGDENVEKCREMWKGRGGSGHVFNVSDVMMSWLHKRALQKSKNKNSNKEQ